MEGKADKPRTVYSVLHEQDIDDKPRTMLHSVLHEQDIDDHEPTMLLSSSQEKRANEDEVAKEELCIECEDQPIALHCVQCNDSFCVMCFDQQHRKGNRLIHTTCKIGNVEIEKNVPEENDQDEKDDQVMIGDWWEKRPALDYFIERSKYTPLRLRLKKRKWMRMLKASLRVMDYADIAETSTLSKKQKMKQTQKQVKSICGLFSGFIVVNDYKRGQEVVETNNYKEYEEVFREFIEIGRRHKIRNPEKMRSIYGKLIFLLQDAVRPVIAEMLEFNPIGPIKTVYSFLEERNSLHILKDKLVPLATGEIMAEGKQRPAIKQAIRRKENAITRIAQSHENHSIREEEIRLCLLSIGDNHSYLRFNRDPCTAMIRLLKRFFSPSGFQNEQYSLAITADKDGSRLTHDHALQYHYALQTMTLWETILHNMYKLWHLAEQDLLDPKNPYVVKNTGQGLHRVQPCPRVSKAMRQILYNAQKKVGQWVGSSVIHLGDENVPNALTFIDKYNQVARILVPIVNCIRQLPELYRSPHVKLYIDSTFNSLDDLILEILTDFFRSAFNGSGADNFFSAGSCIDGRLTSAWHWCSMLEEKRFYPLFLLTGFVGFDGKYWGE